LDAVSQADYYAMAGVFMSPRWTSRVIDVDGKFAAEIAELKRLRRQIQRSLTKRWREEDVDLLAAVKKWSSENRPAIDAAKIEQISHVLKPLATADDKSIGPAWKEMADAWKQTRSARLKGNEKFQLVTDFAEPGLPPNWLAEGAGVANGYVRHGTVLVSLAGDEIVRELLHRGYHTSALSSKLPGAIRLPPQDELAGKFIGLNLRGGEWAGYLVVPQNAFQSEAVTFLDPQSRAAKWLSIADSGRKHGVTRVLTEIVTSSLNPNFPPRTGLAKAASTKLPDDDDGFDKRSWFSLTGVVRHDDAGAPADTLDVYQPLFSESPPTSMNMAWTRIERWCQSTLDRWANDKATASDVQLLNWLLSQQLLPNRAADSTELAELSRQYREVESRIGFPRTVNSMDERSLRPVDYRLNVRGNVHDEGAAIHRDFLQVFADQHGVGKSRGSGRLELAEYLGGNRNPQTARVFVNRVWHWMLGAGIVATPSDFGRLGDRPSHPQLLDWLAIKFMEENWSTKRLVRRLALSQTFLQSTTTTRAAWDIDPQNRLLHHYPTRRLEAEEIRDNMLAVSGSLNRELYGRPIDPPRTVEDSKKRLFSGPLDSHGRRSIYMKMSIMDPPKFLVCFNLPDLKLPTGRRDITNGPTQALALLNDPLVVKLSADWGERLSRDPSKTPQERVRAMFVRSLGRPPREAELERWTAAAQSFSNDSDLMADKNAWSELAHAFFNIKEFIYYR
jgi:hypothetical protein